MSAPVEQPPEGSPALRLHRELVAIWATGPGLQRLASVNHSVIGVRFMLTAFVFFAIGGVLGMLTRVQLATPDAAFMGPETYNQVFTMHGSIMLFLFAIPMLEGMAVYLTPKMLGARDLAFPRLTAYGYWCYLFGGAILTGALVAGVAPPDSGWFMYTPLSSNVYTPGVNADVWLLGVTFVEISALTLAVEIVVSTLKMRAPGMSLDRMPIFANRPLIGYRTIVVAIIALAFLSFGIWVHHMFTVGIPHLALAFFSAGSAIVAVPTVVQVFAWLATLAHGRPRWDVPMLYVFGFFFIFVLGGLTGVMLAIVPFNWQAHDSYFVVAHLHYVVAGAFAFPMLAALYYWLPLLTGRTAVHRLSVPAFWLIFIGFNLTFFLMHLVGLLGMPRRVYTYPGHEGWIWLNLLSSVGGFIMTIGFGLLVIDLLVQLRYGRRVRRDPWGAATLEWAMPIPPVPYAFASIPDVDTRADRVVPGELALSLVRGEGYLGFTRNGWQETLGVHITSGAPEQLIVLPRATYLPLGIALATAGAVLAMLFQFYLLSLATALLVAGLFVSGAQGAGLARDYGPMPVGHDVSLPPHTEVASAPPWWALIFTLIADGTLFTSLVFGTLFLWISAPNWPPAAAPEPNLLLVLTAVAALAVAAGAARGSLRAGGSGGAPQGWIALALLALFAAIAALVVLIGGVAPHPREHALGASAAALLGFAALHAGIGVLFLLSNLLRLAAGFVSPRRVIDLRLTRLWLDYTAVTAAIALGLVLALPALAGMLEARP
jgi:cytochrome c oxidase subunit I+III